jgi:DNA repair protein RadC
MHFIVLRSSSARFGVPREKKGQKRRNTMRQNRAPYNKILIEPAEINADGKQLAFPGLYDHIPVYHIELVCDRHVKFDSRHSINNSDDVVALLKDELLKSDREKLLSLMLNTKNIVIGLDVVSIGNLNTSVAHPREIMKSAVLASAASIILAHNHPSGDPAPSREDHEMTERMSKACEILGIKLLDHIIIAEQGTYSFRNAGGLP